MSPSEYQQLTGYFVDQLGRQHRETRTLVEGLFEWVRQEMESLRSEMRSYVGVSVESLRGEIRLVADGVLTNGRQIEENGRRIEENGQRIEENSQRIEANGQRIEANGQRINSLTDRVGSLEVAVSARFADHEDRLGALESS